MLTFTITVSTTFTVTTSCMPAYMQPYLAIPDVGGMGSLQDKAVVGIEACGLFLHLNSSCVKLVGAAHMEQACAIHIIGILLEPVLESSCPAPRVDHHTSLEYQEEVIRLLALHHTYLYRSTTILVVQVDSMDSSSTSLILGRLLQSKA